MACVLSALNVKLVFPTFSLDKPGKKCMDNTSQPIVDLGRDIRVHDSNPNYHYFTCGRFTTANNLYHPRVLEIFFWVTRLVQECIDSEQHPFEAGGDNLEIVIIIRCISSSNPKISYYIADHTHRTLKWFHGDTPKYYNMNSTRMRDCAEYWHHRSKFPVHRRCSPGDREEVVTLLDGVLSQLQDNANADRVMLEDYFRKLDGIPSSSALTDDQTSVLAEVHSEVLKYSLPTFYSATPSLRGKICKSLFGFSLPRFVHNRAHGNLEVTVPQVIQEHERHLNRPTPSPHSITHTGESLRDSTNSS